MGDVVAVRKAPDGAFEFESVVRRGGHSTYRLLLLTKQPEDVGRTVPPTTPIKVSILAKHALSDRAKAFVEHAQGRFREAGFELRFKVVVAQDAAT